MASLRMRRHRCRCSASAIAAAALCTGNVRSFDSWLVNSLRPATTRAAFPTATPRLNSSFGRTKRRKRSSGVTMMAVQDGDVVSTASSTSSTDIHPSNRIGGRRLSGINSKAIQQTPSNMDVVRTAITITAATVISVLLVDSITMRFETVQDWRYAWPLVGTLYVVTGMSAWFGDSITLKDTTDQLASMVPLPSNRWARGFAALAGIGVLAGGFIDAFFPVWYTSPDLLGTRAGIEADSAAILLMLTVGSIASNIDDYCSLTLSEKSEDKEANALEFPSWTLAVVLCTQLWEIASATFYSWGELLGVLS